MTHLLEKPKRRRENGHRRKNPVKHHPRGDITTHIIEIAKKYSDLQNIQYYNGRLFKSKERAEIVENLTKPREEYPVTNYKGMWNTIHWIQQKLHTNSLQDLT